jgi:short-subunit dehydrogenase
LAGRGYALILVARRADRLAALAEECKKQRGVAADILAADLAKPADVELIEKRIANTPSLALLVNNAGFGTTGFFADVDLAKHRDMVQVHATASLCLTHAALPNMIARHDGGIINVASMAAFLAMPNAVTYCATKMFLITFSQALAKELEGTGVHAQVLCPGFTYTEFHDTPEFAKFSRSDVSAGLWMSAEDVVRDSLAALPAGRVLCIPGRRNRLLMALHRSPLGPLLIWALARKRWQSRK